MCEIICGRKSTCMTQTKIIKTNPNSAKGPDNGKIA
jgi:hypothetical protein